MTIAQPYPNRYVEGIDTITGKPIGESKLGDLSRFGPQPLIPQPEGGLGGLLTFETMMRGAAAGGLAGLGEIGPPMQPLIPMPGVSPAEDPRNLDQRLRDATQTIETVAGDLTVEPKTEADQLMTETLIAPIEKLFQIGDKAGAKVLEETGSPALAALSATTIEALPILLPIAGKYAKPIQRVKSSTWWRMKTEPERAVVTNQVARWYREGMSEGEILRRLGKESESYQQAFEARKTPEGFAEPERVAKPEPAQEMRVGEVAPFKMPDIIKPEPAKAVPLIPEVLPKPEVPVEPAKPKAKYKAPKPKKFKEAKTLTGAIRQMGGIDFLHFKGEYKELAPAAKFLKRKTGAMPIDVMETALKDEGWLGKDETLLEVLRSPDRIKQGKVTADILEKKPAELTDQEIELKKQMEYEPEAPPGKPEDYKTIRAEDLPEGKKLTLIEGKSRCLRNSRERPV
jgi:hypothetical protein